MSGVHNTANMGDLSENENKCKSQKPAIAIQSTKVPKNSILTPVDTDKKLVDLFIRNVKGEKFEKKIRF